jgi:hypothetical protein
VEHLLIWTRWFRLLIVDMHLGPDGQGVGYGKMLIRMDRALQVAQALDVPIFFVHPRLSMNPAVPHLVSDDVRIVPPHGWRAAWFTLLWYLGTPFRIGDRWLAVQRTLSQFVLGPVYARLEVARWLPGRVRKWLLGRSRVVSYLKRVNHAYARQSYALWEARYKREVVARGRLLRHTGRTLPPVRLRLPADREREVAAEAARLGIDPNRPIVTVHVRESGFRAGAGLTQRSWDLVRNGKVATYRDAFAALVERGFTVWCGWATAR